MTTSGYVAVDPPTAAQMFDLDMVSGSLADLSPDGILLDVDARRLARRRRRRHDHVVVPERHDA